MGSSQGCVLPPLLFACFIDDVCQNSVHCRFHLYADDLQIYTSGLGQSLSETIRRVNDDLANIRQWSISNYLVLNASKTQSIIFSRSDGSPGADPLCLGGSILTY
jgi:Reverse transcriptase (RNA-dependent DNA polymerase)